MIRYGVQTPREMSLVLSPQRVNELPKEKKRIRRAAYVNKAAAAATAATAAATAAEDLVVLPLSLMLSATVHRVFCSCRIFAYIYIYIYVYIHMSIHTRLYIYIYLCLYIYSLT